jgi:peptidoglycan hydrolase CwlO-like protein
MKRFLGEGKRMRTDQEEIDALRETIKKLQKQISIKERAIHESNILIKEHKREFAVLENRVGPLQASVDSLSAERSRWTRKLKRAGVKI